MIQLYKSTDSGAPVLTPDKGSLNNLLKSVLVTGYGIMPAAGWSLIYEDTINDIAAMQNAGSQACLYSQFNITGFGHLKGCQSVVSGVAQNPTANILVRYDTVGHSDWAMVADDKSFYLKIDTGRDISANQVYFAGDFVSLIAGDLYNFAVAGLSDSSDTAETLVVAYNKGSLYYLKDMLGGNTISGHSVLAGNIGSYNWFGDVNSNVPYPYYGAIFREKPFFAEINNKPRGKLPGLTVFGHNGIDLMGGINMPYRGLGIDDVVFPVSFEGVNYIAMHTRNGVIFLDTDNWWTL